MESKQHAINVLRYWALVEEFTPPEIEKEYMAPKIKSIQSEVFADRDIPWLHKDRFQTHENTAKHTWEYNVFLGFHKLKDILATIKTLFSNDQGGSKGQGNKNTCLLAFKVDVDGTPLKNSLIIPDYVVAIGCVTQCDPPSLAGLDQKSKNFIREKITDTYHNLCDELAQKKEFQPVDFDLLNRLQQDVLKIINWEKIAKPSKTAPQNLIVAHGKEIPLASKGQENPFLSSFFIRHIEEAIKKWEQDPTQISNSLHQYLAAAPPKQRKDLLDNSVLRQCVSPQLMAPARWPCAGDYPLAINQQAAVNLALEQPSGIFSVNGPPGTGKTTLLNDIISNVIFQRACAMTALKNPTDAFEQEAIKATIDAQTYSIWKPKPVLQGYEIIIASNNNEAVENISKAIPNQEAVDPQWKLDYFADLAQHILGMPECWGLCAAPLGKKSYISKFFNKFWKDKHDEGPPGFNHWLLTHKESDKEVAMAWEQAKEEFQNTFQAYKTLQKDLIGAAQVLEPLLAEMQQLQQQKAVNEAKLQNLEDDKIGLEKQRYDCTEQLNYWKKHRPSWWDHFWANGQYQQWAPGYKKAYSAQKAAQKAWEKWKHETQNVHSKLEKLAKKQDKLQKKASNQEKDFIHYKKHMGSNFPDGTFWQQPTEVLQQCTPWHSEKLHKLRGELFVKAMNLHRAFIGRTAQQFHDNLSSLSALITHGKSWPNQEKGGREKEVLPGLWTSLFTVVPVISTTLASIGNFKGLGKEDIGWVLIDEAGQVAPQAAVGAIQCAKRVIVVGDPQQTPPTVTVSSTMSQLFRTHYSLDSSWDMYNTSVQHLADKVTSFGTPIDPKNDSWVGVPLRVHRRCQNPMFEVANKIAYKGLMVQATSPQISQLAQALKTDELPGGSCWFDVKGRMSRTKHWIAEEGNKVVTILKRICEFKQQLPNVYIITPFRHIAIRLEFLLKARIRGWKELNISDNQVEEWVKKSVGTIHTFQGKEAEGVILVLGASNNVRARDWVSGSPNILNVALTRAKDFILVVGDYDVWSPHKYFRVLAAHLQVYPPRKRQGQRRSTKYPQLV